MFSVYHIIWLAISFTAIITGLILLMKHKPEIDKVLTVGCIGAVASEFTKVFSLIELVPSSNGETMHLYIQMEHLPLHLCSLQIIFLFITRFTKNTALKNNILGFMYPTCSVGAFMALLMPSIVPKPISVNQMFTHPIGYEYFLFHSLLIIIGAYIFLSGKVDLKPKNYFITLGLLVLFAFISLYLNSMFASPTYVNGELVSVDYTANFLFTYKTPIGIELTEMWHWYLYLGIIITVAVGFLTLFYIPVFKRAKKTA